MLRKQLIIPEQISEQVYEIILERIISGEYSTGERVDVASLVAEFGVSRSPVKDALNKLHGAGIAVIAGIVRFVKGLVAPE